MKTGFKDNIAPKEGKKQKSLWNFDQPQYDERSSHFVNAGSHYGVGHRTPVGTEKMTTKSAVPYGRIQTMQVSEIPTKNLDLEIRE